MTSVLNVLLPISLFAVFATLCAGVYSLFRGGDFARSHSNKLMRLRVCPAVRGRADPGRRLLLQPRRR
jgi:hypothetical protein